jgi:AAA+ ATPase superfamily predicted ATPase
MKTAIKNPFVISGYYGEAYFCNRKNESDFLIKNINGNVNTTLFAIRRIGKTGLIKHVFHKIEKQKLAVCIYTDIFATSNLQEFVNNLATAVYNKFPPNKGIGKQISEFIKRLRPVITYDVLNGNPEVKFELSKKTAYEKTIQQIFDFLNSQDIKIVIAIDEFQQICNYPEKNVEALLRSYIQSLNNTVFIFCGSNFKIMHEMFNNAKRPFYASCSNLNLDFINEKDYARFIEKHFSAKKYSITKDAIDFILEWTCSHTYYTQLLCNKVFENATKNISIDDVIAVCQQIHNQEEGIYFQYRNLLTQAQWNVLKAIAIEEKVEKPNAKEFIQKHKLGAVSSVNRSIEALMEKDLIHKTSYTEKPYYMLNDKFLMRWFQRK